jgi:hypothetical protein
LPMRSSNRYRPSTVPAAIGSLPMEVVRTLAVTVPFGEWARREHETWRERRRL